MLEIWIPIMIALFGAACLVVWLIFRKRRRLPNYEQARAIFFERREWLEADFFKLGAQSGMPRGLEWSDVDFDNNVEFARDRKSGHLTAFVGVSIRFEAIEGGDMEDVEAVADEKAATAVFRYDGSAWAATGKAVFNLNPTETIQYYQNELEKVS